MKKIFLITFLLNVIVLSYAQETEGDATKQRIKKIFNKEYKEQKYNIYSGKIFSKLSSDRFIISYDSTTIDIAKTDLKYKGIFEKGILYPSLLRCWHNRELYICCFEELTYTESSSKYRRYSIWVFQKGFMNPNLFVFELKNEKANENTSIEDFIKDAHMTFFEYGWTII